MKIISLCSEAWLVYKTISHCSVRSSRKVHQKALHVSTVRLGELQRSPPKSHGLSNLRDAENVSQKVQLEIIVERALI